MKAITLRLFGTREMPHVTKNAKGHRRAYNYQLKQVIKKKFVSTHHTHINVILIGYTYFAYTIADWYLLSFKLNT